LLISATAARGTRGKDMRVILTQLYAPLYRNMVFPFYDSVLRHRKTYSFYRDVSRVPWLSADEIEGMRRKRLRALVEYCGRNVPYYRSLFAERGIDLSGVDDVGRLRDSGISMTRQDIRSNIGDFISEDFRREDLVCNYSSGTTGVPLAFYKTMDNWCLRMAVKLRSEDWIGKHPGTPSAIIWGHKANLGRISRARRQLYWNFQNYRFLSALDIGEESLLRYVHEIKCYGARYIESYVNPVYLMAKTIEKYGIDPPRLDGIVTGAERLQDFQKEKMEEVFRCPVYDRYGCSEFTNISCECGEHRGQHINADLLWVEVVDKNDRPVIGEEGEVVVTDLMNYAMPFIRYHLGDMAVMTGRRCPCGRNFPMLERVIGKETGTFTAPDGFECHRKYFQWTLQTIPGIFRFQFVEKSSDHILMRVIHDGKIERVETERLVKEAFSELAAHGVSITVEFVDRIPLTGAGKMSFFVSERDVRD